MPTPPSQPRALAKSNIDARHLPAADDKSRFRQRFEIVVLDRFEHRVPAPLAQRRFFILSYLTVPPIDNYRGI
jgi:hypothetical protein